MKNKYGLIYKVTNKINGKVYIGQTTLSLSTRRKEHLKNVKYGSKFHFHNAIRKFGSINFIWEIIDIAKNRIELNKKECLYIKEYNSFNKKYGYNMTFGGEGMSPNEELRTKISKSNIGKHNYWKGKNLTDEHKQKLSISKLGNKNGLGNKARKGLPVLEETKQKISNKLKGHEVNQNTRDKISKGNKGKIRSVECRKAHSEKMKGRQAWNKGIPMSKEAKDKLRVINIGKKHSKEQIEKQRTSIKIYWQNKKLDEIKKVSGL